MIFLRATLRICAVGSASVGHAQDYAAWKKVNKDGSWTLAAKSTIKATKLVTLVPKNITVFRPAYDRLDADKRMRFWVGLLSSMAKPESGFKPETEYVSVLRAWRGHINEIASFTKGMEGCKP